MSNYQHILVALDFSTTSNSVLDKAVEIAHSNSSALTLFHAVECSDALYVSDLVMPVDTLMCEDMSKHAQKQLHELADTLDLKNLNTRVAIGVAKHEIIHAAREAHAELIVLGSHGRHGLQLLLGSTANGVLHLANCDVLAVRVAEKI